jgi:hypothetical protein
MTRWATGWAFTLVCFGLAPLGCRSKALVPMQGAAIADAGLDTAKDLESTESGRADAGTGHDAHAAHDAAKTDATAADVARHDASADFAGGDGVLADAGVLGCGSLRVNCAPFICEVDAGRCNTFCTGPADCAPGRACAHGVCGILNEVSACAANDECASGFCADGVCCATACSGACMNCAMAGHIGVCEPVASGGPDPHRLCPRGAGCGGPGSAATCVPKACLSDQDCGDALWCTNGYCQPCSATCASDPDCVTPSVCVHRNSCTYCAPRDAGATSS